MKKLKLPQFSLFSPGINIYVFVFVALLSAFQITHFAINRGAGLGAAGDRVWITWPTSGVDSENGYARSAMVRNGGLPVGGSEGLMLTALADSEGRLLNSSCEYVITGNSLFARWWSFAVLGTDKKPLGQSGRLGFSSDELLRNSDGGFKLFISGEVSSGNWLQIKPDNREIAFVFWLYDANLASLENADAGSLPRIIQGTCQ